jgi:hypothetical protein
MILLDMTHETSNKMRIKCHISLAKLPMDKRVVYDFLTLLAKTILIDKGKTSPLKVINRKNLIQKCCPREESNTRKYLHLLNTLLRKHRRLIML